MVTIVLRDSDTQEIVVWGMNMGGMNMGEGESAIPVFSTVEEATAFADYYFSESFTLETGLKPEPLEHPARIMGAFLLEFGADIAEYVVLVPQPNREEEWEIYRLRPFAEGMVELGVD
jgi:hypothetical protein